PLVATAFAQSTVGGKVTDRKGESIPGVNILVKGTTSGTISDVEGNYSVNVPEEGILIFSFIGYIPQEVPVNSRSTINITMEDALTSLDEVVVTPLGILREARSLTYSTQSISTEELAKARELNLTSSLQGKVPGLNITSSGTGVGASNRVILRGNRSISGDSQPLYVIDGVPIIGNP